MESFGATERTLDVGVGWGPAQVLSELPPTPTFVSLQWFKRPEAFAERMPSSPPPPSRARGASCGTAVGAGQPGRGAGRTAASTADSSPAAVRSRGG